MLKLKTYNIAFLQLWELNPTALDTAPYLRDVLDLHKARLPEIENWETFREDMLKHITACTPFTLKLKNKQKISVTPAVLPDTSLMITYRRQ